VITVWTVTYVNDEQSEEIGSRVFTTEAEAEAWADEYVGADAWRGRSGMREGRNMFAYVEKHEVADTARSAS
jgi:hypothetical protein